MSCRVRRSTAGAGLWAPVGAAALTREEKFVCLRVRFLCVVCLVFMCVCVLYAVYVCYVFDQGGETAPVVPKRGNPKRGIRKKCYLDVHRRVTSK